MRKVMALRMRRARRKLLYMLLKGERSCHSSDGILSVNSTHCRRGSGGSLARTGNCRRQRLHGTLRSIFSKTTTKLSSKLPGLNAKDIDVRLENNVLVLKGERHFEK